MKLSFSTLGCPDWSFDEVLRRGREYGYDGVAFRGLGAELDLTKIPDFVPPERARARRSLAEAGLAANLLATSAKMLIADPEALEASQRLAEDHIDLAADLECPSIRVFGGAIAPGLSHPAALRWAGDRLRRLGDHAAKRGVMVLVETHDDFVAPDILRRLMEATGHPAVGVLWDIGEQWRIVGRPAEEVWRTLRPWIKACDLKDSVADFSARMGYRFVRTGTGELPLREILTLLVDEGYDGWLTYEWEKRWSPEIADPEDAFPHHLRTVRAELARLGRVDHGSPTSRSSG